MALRDPRDPHNGPTIFVITLVCTAAAAGFLSSGIGTGDRSHVTGGLLAIGATYTAVVLGHRGGPLSAGLVGLALLALAHLTHAEQLLAAQISTRATAWTRRATCGVVLASAWLDVVVWLVAGGGQPRPGMPSTLSLIGGCAVVTAVVAGLTALADGVGLPTRAARTEEGTEPPL